MKRFDFNQIVEILSNPETLRLGIAGKEGAVSGISEDESGIAYAVAIDSTVYMMESWEIVDTGRWRKPRDPHSGRRLAVPAQDYREDAQDIADNATNDHE